MEAGRAALNAPGTWDNPNNARQVVLDSLKYYLVRVVSFSQK